MYQTLNDAAVIVGPELAVGETEIWYLKPEVRREIATLLYTNGETYPDRVLDTLISKSFETHFVLLGKIACRVPETIFAIMQGECWSPEGQARDLILRLGLRHTSMSVGDVIVIDGKVRWVESIGFGEIT